MTSQEIKKATSQRKSWTPDLSEIYTKDIPLMTSGAHLQMCRFRLLPCSSKEGGNIRVRETVPADNLKHYGVVDVVITMDVVKLSHHKKTKVRLK